MASERRPVPAWWRRFLIGRRPVRTLARVAVIVVASVAIFGFWLMPIRAYGDSMRPTYDPGSLEFVNLWAYTWQDPVRGDVVAIRTAGRRVVYVKRIVGLPGERIHIALGVVHVNGVPLEEPYVKYRFKWTVSAVTLGSGEYFVIGDNRGMRREQHEFGTVDRDRIVGKVLF